MGWIIFIFFGFIFLIFGTFAFFLFRFIYKKIKAKTPEQMQEEREEMTEKVEEKKESLIPWRQEHIGMITNRLNYAYDGLNQRFRGTIQSTQSERIVTFRRNDYGIYENAKIYAASSSFNFYFDYVYPNLRIEKDGKLFGEVRDHKVLINAEGTAIGSSNRMVKENPNYQLIINGYTAGDIQKNTDRRTSLRNPFYRGRRAVDRGMSDNKMTVEQEVDYYRLLNSSPNDLRDQQDYDWVLAMLLFEVIYYSIDFSK